MQYTIVGFDKATGQIEVECEGETFALTLPVRERLYPTGDELHRLILSFIPVESITRRSEVPQVVNAAQLRLLVGQPREFTADEVRALQSGEPASEALIGVAVA